MSQYLWNSFSKYLQRGPCLCPQHPELAPVLGVITAGSLSLMGNLEYSTPRISICTVISELKSKLNQIRFASSNSQKYIYMQNWVFGLNLIWFLIWHWCNATQIMLFTYLDLLHQFRIRKDDIMFKSISSAYALGSSDGKTREDP